METDNNKKHGWWLTRSLVVQPCSIYENINGELVHVTIATRKYKNPFGKSVHQDVTYVGELKRFVKKCDCGLTSGEHIRLRIYYNK